MTTAISMCSMPSKRPDTSIFRAPASLDVFSAAGPGRKEFRIGETGFGAGRVVIALMDFLDNCGITDIAITYNSVELHPDHF